jgi:hypothetical protein
MADGATREEAIAAVRALAFGNRATLNAAVRTSLVHNRRARVSSRSSSILLNDSAPQPTRKKSNDSATKWAA